MSATTTATKRVFAATIPGRPVPAARMTQAQVKRLRAGLPLGNEQIARYLDWKATVGWTAKEQGAWLMEGRLSLRVWLYLRVRGGTDLSNILKGIEDGLQGVCFKNDNQIDHIVIHTRLGYPDERVDVEVRTI